MRAAPTQDGGILLPCTHSIAACFPLLDVTAGAQLNQNPPGHPPDVYAPYFVCEYCCCRKPVHVHSADPLTRRCAIKYVPQAVFVDEGKGKNDVQNGSFLFLVVEHRRPTPARTSVRAYSYGARGFVRNALFQMCVLWFAWFLRTIMGVNIKYRSVFIALFTFEQSLYFRSEWYVVRVLTASEWNDF